MEHPICENCEEVKCEWNCQYEQIMFILNTHTKAEQKQLLKYCPKDLLRRVKEKNEEFKARLEAQQ